MEDREFRRACVFALLLIALGFILGAGASFMDCKP